MTTASKRRVDARDEDFVDVNDNGGPRVATGGFDWKQYGLTQPPGAVDVLT